jgi:hypothetical protein
MANILVPECDPVCTYGSAEDTRGLANESVFCDSYGISKRGEGRNKEANERLWYIIGARVERTESIESYSIV